VKYCFNAYLAVAKYIVVLCHSKFAFGDAEINKTQFVWIIGGTEQVFVIFVRSYYFHFIVHDREN
jgi:hypothetical protein